MTSYVVDTHPLVWARSSSKKKILSKSIKKIFDNVDEGKDILYVPMPVIWELGSLFKSKRLNIKNYDFFKQWFKEEILFHENIVPLETTLDDVLIASDLQINADPFDNLIVASSIRVELPLITKDENIISAKICKTIW